MTIEAIIFDVGGVMLRTKSWALRHKWDDHMGWVHGTVEELWFNSERGRATQHGKFTEEAHWVWMGEQLGLSAENLTQLRHDFWAGDELDLRLIDLIRALHQTHKMGIISNAMDGLRSTIEDEWQIADAFDVVVVSAEFGTMKPHPSIYEQCCQQLGVQPANAVFIDDFQHNIVGANAIGMAGIHYPPSKQVDDLIADLADLGVTMTTGNTLES